MNYQLFWLYMSCDHRGIFQDSSPRGRPRSVAAWGIQSAPKRTPSVELCRRMADSPARKGQVRQGSCLNSLNPGRFQLHFSQVIFKLIWGTKGWNNSRAVALKMNGTGPWFNIKMPSYQYRKSHCGDKTVVRSSYLHSGISYTGKTTSLYWIRALDLTDDKSTQHLYIESGPWILLMISQHWFR